VPIWKRASDSMCAAFDLLKAVCAAELAPDGVTEAGDKSSAGRSGTLAGWAYVPSCASISARAPPKSPAVFQASEDSSRMHPRR
jgi:hypothetical protein